MLLESVPAAWPWPRSPAHALRRPGDTTWQLTWTLPGCPQLQLGLPECSRPPMGATAALPARPRPQAPPTSPLLHSSHLNSDSFHLRNCFPYFGAVLWDTYQFTATVTSVQIVPFFLFFFHLFSSSLLWFHSFAFNCTLSDKKYCYSVFLLVHLYRKIFPHLLIFNLAVLLYGKDSSRKKKKSHFQCPGSNHHHF